MMFILNPELGEEEIEAALDRLQNIIHQGGGEITNLDKWGKRRLAYEVRKFRKALCASKLQVSQRHCR